MIAVLEDRQDCLSHPAQTSRSSPKVHGEMDKIYGVRDAGDTTSTRSHMPSHHHAIKTVANVCYLIKL